MKEIRVSRGIEINVNDAEETICIPVEDQNLTVKFFGLVEMLENIEKEAGKADRESIDGVKHMIELTKELMAEIDNMFGQESCRKIFGDIVPGPYALADFFEQVTPIIEDHMDKRQKEIAQKYNRRKKGARKHV